MEPPRRSTTFSRPIGWLSLRDVSIFVRRCFRECKKISIGEKLFRWNASSWNNNSTFQENYNLWYIACDISTIFTLSVWCTCGQERRHRVNLRADVVSRSILSWQLKGENRRDMRLHLIQMRFSFLGSVRADIDVNDWHRQRYMHAWHLRSLQCKHA